MAYSQHVTFYSLSKYKCPASVSPRCQLQLINLWNFPTSIFCAFSLAAPQAWEEPACAFIKPTVMLLWIPYWNTPLPKTWKWLVYRHMDNTPSVTLLFSYPDPSLITYILVLLLQALWEEAGWLFYVSSVLTAQATIWTERCCSNTNEIKGSTKDSWQADPPGNFWKASERASTAEQGIFNILNELLQEASHWLHSAQKGRQGCLFCSAQLA